MSTTKRRKLNVAAEPPQATSAFALRKRLLGDRNTVEQSGLDTSDETDVISAQSIEGDTKKPPGPKKPKKGRKVQPTSSEENTPNPSAGEPPLGSLPLYNTVSVESTEALPTSTSPPTTEDDLSYRVNPVQFSNFNPSRNNYQRRKDGRLSLKLSDGERLVILGSYGVHMKSGEITINGAALRPSKTVHWVDAPHCHALPVIRCSDSATLELLPHPIAAGLRSLGRLSPRFRRLWNEPSASTDDSSPDSTFQILYTSADGPKRTLLQDLVSPPEWNKEIARFVTSSSSRPVSVMVTGPKSSGKSTFGKILANRLITDALNDSRRRGLKGVAVLDLDPGQPEYCISGQVALVLLTEPVFGPSFCRPIADSDLRLLRSHALASTSPASDPELLVEAATDLMTHYRNALGTYPLIINTPGWIQGTGLDVLTSLITVLRPTEVAYMSQSGPAEAIESLQEVCNATNFSTLPSQTTQYTSRTSAHLRSMQTMSYFHAERRSAGPGEPQVQWNPRPLTAVPPWQVRYTGLGRGIFGIMCYEYQAPSDLLADAINGTILAAVEVESAKAFRDLANYSGPVEGGSLFNASNSHASNSMMDIDGEGSQEPTLSLLGLRERITATTPEGIPFINTTNGTTLDPRYSQSIGLVLIRGIDVKNGVLQLLTPIPSERVEEVNAKGGEIVLVTGKFDTPSWAYTEDFYYQSQSEGLKDGEEGLGLDEEDSWDDGSDMDESDSEVENRMAQTPWIEILYGNQKRSAGSKAWRVRRNLGRTGNAVD
ncbi:hypothetical protein F4779DRAFT_151929 [Xylariaceae sp. FL0662B]|nr:hypothetical protein F4779DRAFT_151929 [Xylariaceae sp. FL0662B]